ncbi:recombination protein [Pseudanabaena phage Pam5]|nr:recombination protein [Pseudanabaena phage Pam5]
MTEDEIRKLFAKFDAELFKKDVWTVQNATVIKHSALERLAAAAGIKFDQPQVIRAERDEAVILATGHLGERSEWSIGEALINMNYRVSGKQAGYVYAMAEKRAKDRVIIKLANLHGLYSEDEADEFKEQSQPAPMTGRAASPPSERTSNGGDAPLSPAAKAFISAADKARSAEALAQWIDDVEPELSKLPVHEVAAVKDHARAVWKLLSQKEAA